MSGPSTLMATGTEGPLIIHYFFFFPHIVTPVINPPQRNMFVCLSGRQIKVLNSWKSIRFSDSSLKSLETTEVAFTASQMRGYQYGLLWSVDFKSGGYLKMSVLFCL